MNFKTILLYPLQENGNAFKTSVNPLYLTALYTDTPYQLQPTLLSLH